MKPRVAAAQFGAFGDRLFVLRGAAPEIEVYSSAGRLIERWRWPLAMRPARDVFDRAKAPHIAAAPEASRAGIEDFYAQPWPRAEFVPSYQTTVLPVGFDVMQIGGDFLLGASRDAMGIERVLMYSYTNATR